MINGMNDEPKKLADALKDLPKEHVFIPPDVDERILKAAGERFQRPGFNKISRFPRWGSWAAVAAAVAIIMLLVRPFTPTSKWEAPPAAAYHESDINQDGAVDVIDALALAQASSKNSPGLDLNRDGTFDERDTTELLNSLVRLDTGGPL